jgi:phage-related protein
MTDTFTWRTRAGITGTETTSVISAQFGDGYKQIAANGINTSVESWNLTWTGKTEEVLAIRNFLRSHVVTSFWWTNPWGETLLYRVKSDSVAPGFQAGKVTSLAFTFEQAFAP